MPTFMPSSQFTEVARIRRQAGASTATLINSPLKAMLGKACPTCLALPSNCG